MLISKENYHSYRKVTVTQKMYYVCISSQTGLLNMTLGSLYSNGLTQLSDLNPIEYLWDVAEDLNNRCAVDKSAKTV